MVKSYQRYEQAHSFGVITSRSNVIHIPSHSKSNSGQVLTAGLEEILLWDIKTGELVKKLSDGLPIGSSDAKLGKPSVVTRMTYHNETNLLAAGYDDGSIKVWDILSGIVLVSFQGHKSAVTQLEFDAEGTRLVSGSRDASLIFWDLVGEIGLFKLKGHKGEITGVWFNDDWLISTSKDGLIKVWDLKTQQCIETHVAHSGECWAVGVQGSTVITSGPENQLKLWELDLSEEESNSKLVEVGVLEKQSKSRATAIVFSTVIANQRFFYVQNTDKTLELFRLRTEDEINKATKKREKRLKEKGYEPEEVAKSIADSRINILVQAYSTIRSLYKISSVTWAQVTSSKLDLLISTASNTLEYHSISYSSKEASPAEKLYTLDLQGHRTDIRSIDLSTDNKLLASASNGLLKIWNVKTQKCLRTFECGYALVVKFLPGGTLVVVGTRNGELELYDLATSTLLDSVQAHEGAVWCLDLSESGSTMVTGSADKTVKFWEFKVEQELIEGTKDKYVAKMKIKHQKTMDLGEDILTLKISPWDKYLAVSLLDNTVKVFFFDTLKFFISLYGHKLPVLSIDISSDSKLIITSSADKNIKIWGLDFGDCHKSIFGHQDSIMCVRFLNDSHNFFSCGKDGLVKYWDGDKFENVQKLAAHQSEVWSLAIAKDNSFVVSASHDHSMRIWEETEDEVFLEEEKEKEMDELYESNLLNSLEPEKDSKRDDEDEEDAEDKDSSEQVNKQTMETLKAGEKLLEALELGYKDMIADKEYQTAMTKWQRSGKLGEQPSKPVRDALLQALGKTGVTYILETIQKIKPAHMEDALLVLPFSFVLKLLEVLQSFINTDKILKENLSVICTILFFIIRTNLHELNSLKDNNIKQVLESSTKKLRSELKKLENEVGFNTQGLLFVKNQWKLRHNTQFIDEAEQREADDKKATKRAYQTVA
ncbi:hypothetical protein WICPIJ_007647 [Wickerhamomyces pijperi]|uniref:Small-subunit processome Utp12 domain-containing protein n=1 Tax=Wickerhamomyces pijperi TaxID=599730 RepID=A0A9P8TJ12_WICPI|nr:hypothetical protein WICPIJ_007647 [Wickerhamomyces pijperi]